MFLSHCRKRILTMLGDDSLCGLWCRYQDTDSKFFICSAFCKHWLHVHNVLDLQLHFGQRSKHWSGLIPAFWTLLICSYKLCQHISSALLIALYFVSEQIVELVSFIFNGLEAQTGLSSSWSFWLFSTILCFSWKCFVFKEFGLFRIVTLQVLLLPSRNKISFV